jgi:hypothetical protein
MPENFSLGWAWSPSRLVPKAKGSLAGQRWAVKERKEPRLPIFHRSSFTGEEIRRRERISLTLFPGAELLYLASLGSGIF